MRRSLHLLILAALISITTLLTSSPLFDSSNADTAIESGVVPTTPNKVLNSLNSVEGALVDLLKNPRPEGCHQSAHEIGRQASYTADPLKALQLNTPEVDQLCQYGYVHGLFQGYATKGVSAVVIATTSCPAVPGAPGVVSECFHASGHGVAITKASLTDALEECATVYSPHDLNCAAGVYMEYMDRYWLGDAISKDSEGYAPLLSEKEALSICAGASQRLVAICAKEAPAFWGRSNNTPTFLGLRCRELANSTTVDVIQSCGVGVGRRFQNDAVWNLSGTSRYPETIPEAREISRSLATSCEEATKVAGALKFWSGCIEAAIQPMLSGQILTKTPSSIWIDPCPVVLDKDESYNLHPECMRIRTAVISDTKRILRNAS